MTRNRSRWRTGRWVALGLAAVVAFAVVSTWLTAPRLGGRMDPAATTPLGAHALITLLRDRGVEVVVASTVEEVERAARPDSLLLIAETANTRGDALLHRLAAVPGDRLIVEPTALARTVLTPGLRVSKHPRTDANPDCALPEANRAGAARLESAASYQRPGPDPVTRCYGGAVVRYSVDGQTTTVVGTSDFMLNSGLLQDGNAALAMNLAGTHNRLIWYAPQRIQGDTDAGASITELIPPAFYWVAAQLCVVVVLLALWQAPRLGPLVAERLPVVVRASEAVEGRARLYRSTRARAQAATALRTATLQRVTPRLGLGVNAPDTAVATAVAQRCRGEQGAVAAAMFGPPPQTDADLCQLAQALDDIERQVSQS